MSQIILDDVTVRYSIFDASSRSLKRSLVAGAVGGNLSKTSSRATQVTALSGITLALKKGDRLGVYGHNGSGKTTLLKVLAGIYPPSEGRITIEGTIGSFIDIAAGVDNDLNGYDIITLRGLVMGRSYTEIEAQRAEIIAFSGLGDFIAMPIRTYSSGMWARLAFAIATAFHSDIILLDEWLSVGDGEFAKKAELRLQSVIAEAAILVVASHTMDLLKTHCNIIMYLDKGHVANIERFS